MELTFVLLRSNANLWCWSARRWSWIFGWGSFGTHGQERQFRY